MNFDFNTAIAILGTVFGLFGIIISIYAYRKSKKTKKLTVNSESTILISEKLSQYENLKISYNSEDISSLTSTIVKIKNIGTDIVEPSDLIPSSPIIVNTTQKFLLNDSSQYEIYTSNNKNKVSLVKINESSLQLMFEFLNPKDEITISLLHTGSITVSGDLKTNPIKNYTSKKYENNGIKYNNDDDSYIPSSNILFRLLTSIITLAMMILVYYYILSGNLSPENMLLYTMLMFMMILQVMQNFQNRK